MALKLFITLTLVAVCISLGWGQDESETVESSSEKPTLEKPLEDKVLHYSKPEVSGFAYIAEPFHSKSDFDNIWTISQAKKDGVEAAISKYDGMWAIEEPSENPIKGDNGLVLKTRAKHHAVSTMLPTKFEFNDRPLMLQYEVKFQIPMECGGAYLKLLSEDPKLDLEEFTDKSAYTIMFGPDKCGEDSKLHFIFRHKNGVNGKYEEKHAKKPTGDFSKIFDDKKTHLVTLIVKPDNTFEISVDKKSMSSGSLLSDFTPAVNPPKEIDDPSDKKPEDWDDKEKIADPDAKKPEDWDEDAPKRIVDAKAKKPEGWLDDAPANIGDPSAKRPVDWDDEEDGEWEAPQIANPKCAEVGCGEWKAPMIDNPNYKGKWEPPVIRNPAYKGIWAPKKIVNPDYFEDFDPFKMTSVAAIGFELWSMTGDIVFDNVIITDQQSVLDKWTADTWDLKHGKEFEAAAGVGGGIVDTLIDATKERPWLWFIYVCVVFLPFILILAFCLPGKKDKDAERKKTDEPTPDDPEIKEGEDDESVEEDDKAECEHIKGDDKEAESDSVKDEDKAEDGNAKEEPDAEVKDESQEEPSEAPAKEEVEQKKDEVVDEPPHDASPRTRAMRRKTRKDT